MFCVECGSQLTDEARFCRSCGRAVRTPEGPGSLTPDIPVHPAPAPDPPAQPTPAAGSRSVGGRVVAVAVVAGMLLAALGGWAAHLVPVGASESRATGVVEPQGGVAPASSSADPDGGETTTSFVTSCGRVLDIVPVSAAAAGEALEVTLEVRPVCPTGEWISSNDFRVVMTDAEGIPLAQGTFDLSESRLFVPGFGDPDSRLLARFAAGTAWAAPDSMAADIADGTVLVECEALDDAHGEPAESGEVTEAASTTVYSRGEDVEAMSRESALQALRRQVRADGPSVTELEGAWVPQLSSKKEGTYDDYDGRMYSLADIYQQFLALRLKYPNLRLLNSTDWHSYSRDGYWVVVAGVSFVRPREPNGWCDDRGIPPSQCFAKRLLRDGAPEGATRHRH